MMPPRFLSTRLGLPFLQIYVENLVTVEPKLDAKTHHKSMPKQVANKNNEIRQKIYLFDV